MKILLFGKYGQLGWELYRSLQPLGEVAAYDFPEVDFTKPSSLKPLFERAKPEVVINAAAYTDVDKAESETEKARLINAEAPAVLAETCRALGAAFIHYSTDYVFDGKKGSLYTEADKPNPLNVYGRTKLEGEEAVKQAGGTYLIFRTAWVYSMRRECFVTKVLRWARSQTKMRIVDDQVSSPTWARALADVTGQLLSKAGSDPISWLTECCGLYHLAGRGAVSRLKWAEAIIENDPIENKQIMQKLVAAKSEDFANEAERPYFSALDCSKFGRKFALILPDWRISLCLAMKDINHMLEWDLSLDGFMKKGK
jgi:dTDP-4-dehydrorhamnose reductase